jgi:hypothetical protein
MTATTHGCLRVVIALSFNGSRLSSNELSYFVDGGGMSDLDAKLSSLERQWRDADDLAQSAQAELAAIDTGKKQPISAAVIAVQERIERAKRLKKQIIQQIEALEENLLCDS